MDEGQKPMFLEVLAMFLEMLKRHFWGGLHVF